jgi:hypothetical protein
MGRPASKGRPEGPVLSRSKVVSKGVSKTCQGWTSTLNMKKPSDEQIYCLRWGRIDYNVFRKKSTPTDYLQKARLH